MRPETSVIIPTWNRRDLVARAIDSVLAQDFGDFELSFYLSTQMAARQLMVFHGDKGFIEVHAPFNAGLYDHHRVELHNQMAVDIDLSGWRLDGGIGYAFADGTIIPAGGYLVIASDPAAVPGSLGPL